MVPDPLPTSGVVLRGHRQHGLREAASELRDLLVSECSLEARRAPFTVDDARFDHVQEDRPRRGDRRAAALDLELGVEGRLVLAARARELRIEVVPNDVPDGEATRAGWAR